MSEKKPAQGLPGRGFGKRWPVTYGTYRKARRAQSFEASRKELRHAERVLRRRIRDERHTIKLCENFLRREREKARKRRHRERARRDVLPPEAKKRLQRFRGFGVRRGAVPKRSRNSKSRGRS